jgi:deoxyribonuclease-4
MLKIGAHMSTSQGFGEVVKRTKHIGGNTFQIFSHNPRSWRVRGYDKSEFEGFKTAMKENNVNFSDVLVHAGYLINLSSFKDDMWEKSINLAIQEIIVTAKLGIKHYNVHPGSHLGKGEEYAFDRISKALDRILTETKDLGVTILLENVAKKGNNIGWNMKQLGKIISRASYKDCLGITYDTCHGFDSYYDISKKDGVEKLLNEIDTFIGLEKFKMIHLNDSKYPLGAAKDRHEFIGQGYIGIKGFENFLSFEEILKRPLILETPGDDSVHAKDIETVKSIVKSLTK